MDSIHNSLLVDKANPEHRRLTERESVLLTISYFSWKSVPSGDIYERNCSSVNTCEEYELSAYLYLVAPSVSINSICL